MVTSVFSISTDDGRLAAGPSQSRERALRDCVAGPENALLQTAADSVFDHRTTYSPLVLVGPSGAGKSSFIRGLVAHWNAVQPALPVVAMPARLFARDYVARCHTGGLGEFRSRFRAAKMVVIDDLDLLASKPACQREIALVLGDLLDRAGLFVAALRTMPASLTTWQPALISRLSAGLVVPVVPPSEHASKALLLRLAPQHRLLLDPRAAHILSRSLRGAAADIDSALSELAQSVGPNCQRIDARQAQRFVDHRLAQSQPSLRQISDRVSKYFHVNTRNLLGPRRHRSVTIARGIAIFLAREQTGKSLREIGVHFGGRDHSTILHAYRQTERMLKSSTALATAVQELAADLSGRLHG